MKFLLSLLTAPIIASSTIATININHQTSIKQQTQLTPKFTKIDKTVHDYVHWNNTSGFIKETDTNKLFFMSNKGEFEKTNLYNQDLNPNGFAKVVNSKYAILIGASSLNTPFSYYLINSNDHKLIKLNSYKPLKYAVIAGVQVIDSNHVLVNASGNGFLLTISDSDEVRVTNFNLNTELAVKLNSDLIALSTRNKDQQIATLVYSVKDNKIVQTINDVEIYQALNFNDESGVLISGIYDTYTMNISNNWVTMNALNIKSAGIDKLNNDTIITSGITNGDSYQINSDETMIKLEHGGHFILWNDNIGAIFNYAESYLISQDSSSKEINYTAIKVNDSPLDYTSLSSVIGLNNDYLMITTLKDTYSTYVIDKTGVNVEFSGTYYNFSLVDEDTSLVNNLITNETGLLTLTNA